MKYIKLSSLIIRWTLFILGLLFVTLILWNTYRFMQNFKREERFKMEIWAKAVQTINDTDVNSDVDIELPLEIVAHNATIPIIQVDSINNIINTSNIDESIVADSIKLYAFFNKIKEANDPIVVSGNYSNTYIYYGNSSIINSLTYYPILLILILCFIIAILIYLFSYSKKSVQNNLWAGMAKETAHQLGTPITSLIGWVDYMHEMNFDETVVTEIKKDTDRLHTIAERFQKIGSEPVLEQLDIIAETKASFAYLRERTSKQVNFTIDAPNYALYLPLNATLHSWCIENLIKNATDAMKGKGEIHLKIIETPSSVQLYVSDTGCGIEKSKMNQIFEPGYSTKKRGWGLGLSLTKRIVKDYHNGKIKVYLSEIDKGTTFLITYYKS
nr:HAMP domain-containing sensor histidine kinase [uncultured Flavobacterium sp.]